MSTTRNPSRGARRAGTAGLVGLMVVGGLTLATQQSADAATKVTRYTFSGSGFGTRVTAGEVALRSAPTAYSVLGCTKAAGKSFGNNVAATQLNDQVKVGAVTTRQQSLALASGTSMAQSVTKVASIALGSDSLGIRITGLQGISRAYATKAGKLNAYSSFTFTKIQALGSATLPPPLNQPIDVLLKQLAAQGPVTIPNLGVVKLGHVAKAVAASTAQSGSMGLEIHLFGTDGKNGGADDSDVVIGRSQARISRLGTHGVFSAATWGIDAHLLNGTAVLGRNPSTPMACEGTGGHVRTASLAELNLGGLDQLVVSGAKNRVYGAQNTPKGGATGWTEDSIADIDLGSGVLHVTGILARAKVIRTSTNHYYPTSVQRIGSIDVNGTSRSIPAPGRAIEIPGVARIEVPKPVTTTHGVSVTALRITLLGGSAANTVINLGTAKASVKAY